MKKPILFICLPVIMFAFLFIESIFAYDKISVATDGSPEELSYIITKDCPIDGDHRYVDGQYELRYKFPIGDAQGIELSIDIGNNYKVEYSFDDENYILLMKADADVHDLSNREKKTVEINVPSWSWVELDHLYLKFGDNSTGDGWGASLYSIGVRESSKTEAQKLKAELKLKKDPVITKDELARIWDIEEEKILVNLIDSDADEQLLISSIQGIINKTGAKIFLINSNWDKKWLYALKKRYSYKFSKVSHETLVEFCGPRIGKQIIYDRNNSYSANIAATLAGIEEALITSRDLGYRTVLDLRNRWKNKKEAYTWAIDNIIPRSNQKDLAFLDEKVLTFRDFIIKENLFTFDLDPLNDEEEIKLIEKIISQFPDSAIVFGWASGKYAQKDKGQNDVSVEHALVKLLSKNNKILVPADYATNLSFYSALQITEPVRQMMRKDKPYYDKNKRYVTFIFSDGDNIQYNLNFMRELWLDPFRKELPLGWTISPQLVRVAPSILDIYYHEAGLSGTDEFVSGPSGYGYVNPSNMKRGPLKKFLELTDDLCRRSDITSVVILDNPGRPQREVERFISAYSDYTALKGLWLADFSNYYGEKGSLVYLSEDVRGNKDVKGVANLINRLSKYKKFIFVYIHAWEVYPKDINKVVKLLNPNVEIVLPSEMIDLFSNHKDEIVIVSADIKPLNKGETLHLVTDGDHEDEYLYLMDRQLPIDKDHRFADGTRVMRYRFKIGELDRISISAEISNNFIMEYSFDDMDYSILLSSKKDVHDFSNRRIYKAEVVMPTDLQSDDLYIRFRDGSTKDGWEPSLYQLLLECN